MQTGLSFYPRSCLWLLSFTYMLAANFCGNIFSQTCISGTDHCPVLSVREVRDIVAHWALTLGQLDSASWTHYPLPETLLSLFLLRVSFLLSLLNRKFDFCNCMALRSQSITKSYILCLISLPFLSCPTVTTLIRVISSSRLKNSSGLHLDSASSLIEF